MTNTFQRYKCKKIVYFLKVYFYFVSFHLEFEPIAAELHILIPSKAFN